MIGSGFGKVSILGRLAAATALFAAQPSLAHDEGTMAPLPENGLAWDVLETTDEQEWIDASTGRHHIRPQFSEAVDHLDKQTVVLAGFMMPFDDSQQSQSRFLLFKYQPDCLFHMTAGPTNFVDVRVDAPVGTTDAPLVVRGVLELVREEKGGIFYRLTSGQILTSE